MFVALLIGIIAGLRAMTAPAAVSWAASLGALKLSHTPLAFMGSEITAIIFTVLAIVELVTDKLSKTPSRKVPMQFGARLVSGGFCGAAVGLAGDAWVGGARGRLDRRGRRHIGWGRGAVSSGRGRSVKIYPPP